VRLLLGMTGPGRGSGPGSAPAPAASRKSSRSRGSGALSKAGSAAAKVASASGKKGESPPAGPGDGAKAQQSQRAHLDDHQHEQQEGQHQQQPKLRKLAISSVQEPSSPRSPRRPVSSPRGVALPRAAAAAFSPGRLQPPLTAADPAGRPGRRRAAAAAAAAVQAATAESVEEDEAAPLARSRGGRVLKRSAAAQVRSITCLSPGLPALHWPFSACQMSRALINLLNASRTMCISRPVTRAAQPMMVQRMGTLRTMNGRCAAPRAITCVGAVAAGVHREVRFDHLTPQHDLVSCVGCRRAATGANPRLVLLMSCRPAAPVTMSSLRRRALSRGLAAAASCGSSRT